MISAGAWRPACLWLRGDPDRWYRAGVLARCDCLALGGRRRVQSFSRAEDRPLSYEC
jgi:hypothetical protein